MLCHDLNVRVIAFLTSLCMGFRAAGIRIPAALNSAMPFHPATHPGPGCAPEKAFILLLL